MFIRAFYLNHQVCLSFTDQYAFQTTSSPTAATIYHLHIILHPLTTNPYDAAISLNFTTASDTVRHSTSFDK